VGRVELFEHVGLELAVLAHGSDDLLALFVTGLFDVPHLAGCNFASCDRECAGAPSARG